MKNLITARSVATAICAGAAAVALALSASPAFATTSKAGTVEETLATIAPEALDDLAQPVLGDEAVEHTSDDVVATVPLDASESITIADSDSELKIDLPFAEDASAVKTASDAVVAFDNGNNSTTAAVVHDDGSVQVNTIIHDADAPERYEYAVSVPEGGSLSLDEAGAVLILDADGSLVGGAAPAWAKDAQGHTVPTHYEVDGSKLVQIVEHSAKFEYPVVADPWWGIRLFQKVGRGTWKGDYTYNAWVTPWGATVLGGGGGIGGYIVGGNIMRGAGWDEWKASWPAITNKATLRQQYDCHVAAGVYGLPFTQEYNLERARANKANWVSNVLNHHCNW